MKKERYFELALIGLFFIFLSASLVFGACDSESGLVMRLSSTENAHGELAGQNNYATEVCWTTSTSNKCELGNGLVMYLSGNTNAHAEIPDFPTPNYATKVCFGSLRCVSKVSPQSCDAGYNVIASLSALTNAHITRRDNPLYPYKICCQGSAVNGRVWMNMEDIQALPEADLNDKVKMYSDGVGLKGQRVEFKIYKKGTFTYDWGKPKATFSKTATEDDKVFYIWKADESGRYKFKTTINGVESLESGELKVKETENDSPPVARIQTPENGEVHITDGGFTLTHSSYDVDDELDATWNLDGSINHQDSFSTSYSTAGQKSIVLNVKERGRTTPLESWTDVGISIYKPEASKQVFANIRHPLYGRTYPIGSLEFKGLGSYAYEVSSAGALTCLTNICPLATKSTPPVPITPAGTPNREADLKYEWTFSNKILNLNIGLPKPVTERDPSVLVEPGDYDNEELKVTFGDVSSTRKVKFFVLSGEPHCFPQFTNPPSALWKYNDGVSNRNIDAMKDCNRDDGKPTKVCCPEKFDCVDDKCIFSGADNCLSYKTESTCVKSNTENPNAARNSVRTYLSSPENPLAILKGKGCGDTYQLEGKMWRIANCRCVWKTNSCGSDYDPINVDTGEIKGTCGYSTESESECYSGYKLVTTKATWSLGGVSEDCPTPDPAQFQCISDAVLGFFGTFGIISTIGVIIVFYIFRIRKCGEKVD